MKKEQMKDWTSGQHKFTPPTAECSRSPCPALNALANHHIIPHSGKNLKFLQMLQAVRAVYNLSLPLAIALTFGGFLLCGRRLGTRLDLHALALHNRIEHDGSLVHEDAKEGEKWAPWKVDERLLDRFVRTGMDTGAGEGEGEARNEETEAIEAENEANEVLGNGSGKKRKVTESGDEETDMSIHDLLEARLRRISQSAASKQPTVSSTSAATSTPNTQTQAQTQPPTLDLSRFHRTVMNGEAALTLLTLGDSNGLISREKLRAWFGEDRLPDGWTADVSGKKIGFTHMNAVAGRLNKLTEELNKSTDGKMNAKKSR